MNGFAEQRMYQRIDNLVFEVSVSMGEEEWISTEPRDISAVGLKFASKNKYAINDNLFINLIFYNMLSPFNLMLKGNIIRIDSEGSRPIYAVKFVDVDKKTQVQLDELVSNALSVLGQRDTIPVNEYFLQSPMPRFDLKKDKLEK